MRLPEKNMKASCVKVRHYAMLAIGLVWLFADIWIIESNTILRETRLGLIAGFIDELPPKLGNLTALALWIGLLFGWAILIGLGMKPFLRKRN